jgi:hypothetical protein
MIEEQNDKQSLRDAAIYQDDKKLIDEFVQGESEFAQKYAISV